MTGEVLRLAGVPPQWGDRQRDFPCSVANLCRLARALAGESVQVRWPWIALPPRNALFLAAVLGHAFRRLLPPY